jgi:putative transposase
MRPSRLVHGPDRWRRCWAWAHHAEALAAAVRGLLLAARGPNQIWSWDITYLPTSVRSVWLYLYLLIDLWSRKVVALDAAWEKAQIAADLVSRACLKERISKDRSQPLILHADNGNAMRAAILESRLEELGVLRSFSRPRVSNANPYSESLFHTV